MNHFVQRLADQLQLPIPVVEQVAAEVAQRCALVANRYQPGGMLTVDQMTAVETLGAEIGTEIIKSFPPAA